jgi:hypothetical protein
MRRPTDLLMLVVFLTGATTASSHAGTLWGFLKGVPEGAVLTFGFQNYDNGVDYVGVPVGTYTGAALAAVDKHATLGANVGKVTWDTWGIAKLQDVEDGQGNTLWNQGRDGIQVYGLFWGEEDTSVLIQTNPYSSKLTDFHIQGTGMQFATFEFDNGPGTGLGQWTTFSNATTSDIAHLGASGLNTSNPTKPTYTGITNGRLILSGSSLPVYGEPEFSVVYSLSNSGIMSGHNNESYFYADNPNSGNGWNTPADNSFLSELQESGYTARFRFTETLQNCGKTYVPGTWNNYSHDPLDVTLTPELCPTALMLLGLIPVGLTWWRRRKM